MADPAATPSVQALAAATVVLVRDGPQGLETLMVVRHHEIDFARGAAVFPGGKVATADRAALLRQHVPSGVHFAEDHLVLRIAAVREVFEESGLLLARRHGRLLDAEALGHLWQRWHERTAASAEAFVDMVHGEGLELALDLLQPFAHWVTPEISPKRFDTYFYIAAAPPGQVAAHDGREAVDSFWIHPHDALRDCEERRRVIIFPTLCNLALLGTSGNAADALADASARTVQRIQPTLGLHTDGRRIPVLPADSGYPPLSAALLDLVAR